MQLQLIRCIEMDSYNTRFKYDVLEGTSIQIFICCSYYHRWIFIVITIKLYQQPKLYEITNYKIYHDVTIFSQLIVHSYRRLYCVNVMIFDLPIHNTLFDSNIDSFIINSTLYIYWNSIHAGLTFLCINKIPTFIYSILTSCIRHIVNTCVNVSTL